MSALSVVGVATAAIPVNPVIVTAVMAADVDDRKKTLQFGVKYCNFLKIELLVILFFMVNLLTMYTIHIVFNVIVFCMFNFFYRLPVCLCVNNYDFIFLFYD